MTTIEDLRTPALVVDADKLDANLARMADRVSLMGARLRPHIKTHKCVEIAQRQRELGCAGITVSTLREAAVFAEHGFEDITWAFPVILNRIAEARRVAERCTLRLVIDSMAAIDALEETRSGFRCWVKIDCGYHRAGVDPNGERVVQLVQRISDSSNLRFDGILTHSGHAYYAASPREVGRIAEQERSVMVELSERLTQRGLAVPAVSIGSTPAMSQCQNLDGVDEVRPGNYVFYDFTQVALGSCRVTDCAVTVIASVVSTPDASDHSVVDAGALALSKDTGPSTSSPPERGRVFEGYDEGRLSRERKIYSLSQEHGLLSGKLSVGSRVRVLPNHSCLTVACFDEYAVVRGNEVVDRWKIHRGR